MTKRASQLAVWAVLVASVCWLAVSLLWSKGVDTGEAPDSQDQMDAAESANPSLVTKEPASSSQGPRNGPIAQAPVAASVLHADGSPAKGAIVRLFQAPAARRVGGGVIPGQAFVTDGSGRIEIPTATLDELGSVIAAAAHVASSEVSERNVEIARDKPNIIRLRRGVRIVGKVIGVPESTGSEVEVLAHGTRWPESPGVRRVALAENASFELLVPLGYMSLQVVCPERVPSKLWKATIDGSKLEEAVTLVLGGPAVSGRFRFLVNDPASQPTQMPVGSVVLVGPVGRGVSPVVLGEDEWISVSNLKAGEDAWVHVLPSRIGAAWATTNVIAQVPAKSWQKGAVIQVPRAARDRFRIVDPSGQSALVGFPMVLARIKDKKDNRTQVGATILGQSDERGEWDPFSTRPSAVGRYEVRDCTGTVLWSGDAAADERVITLTSSSVPLLVRLASSGGKPLQTPNVSLRFVADSDASPPALWSGSFEDSSELKVWYPPTTSLALEVTEEYVRTRRIPPSGFRGRDSLELRASADAASAEVTVQYADDTPAEGQLFLARVDPRRDALYILPVTDGKARIDSAAPGTYEVSAKSATAAPLTIRSSRTVTLIRGTSVKLEIVVARRGL